MTNQQGAPEALANFDAAVAAVLQCVSTAPCNSHEICTWFAANIRERLAALVEAQQPAAHVQNPGEIEHVAGDVSKNGPESNTTQQPTPSAAAAPSVSDRERALHEIILNRLSHAELLEKAHYLMELNSNQARTIGELQDLVSAAPQPSTTPQADSTQDKFISREEWVERAMRVYLIAGDTEDEARECAEYQWGELDMDDIPDPYFTAMEDIEGRGPAPQADSQPAPIDMVLHCPKCGLQHIDAPEQIDRRLAAIDPPAAWAMDPWKNEPHRSHLCHGCGHIWRPADVPTNGVMAVKTTGKADSPIAARAPADSVTAPAGPRDELAVKFLAWCAAQGYPTSTLPNSIGNAPSGGIFADTHARAAWNWECSAHRAAAPPAQAADSVLEDAARWNLLPAFIEKYQIDYVALLRDIDAARKQGANHD